MTEEKKEHISFERLDMLMPVTDPKGWVALVGLYCLVLLSVLWLFYGNISTQIDGLGLLIQSDGTQIITTHTTGKITQFDIKIGELVKKNQIIAYIETDAGKQVELVSPYDGKVFEIEHVRGENITRGATLLSLEPLDNGKAKMQAITYFSAFQEKNIKPGMVAAIEPSTIKFEEYGSLTGIVTHVSEYPSTAKSMMRIFHNEEIVKKIMGRGSQIEVHIDLVSDPNTISKYKWSSKEGPPVIIQSGTECDAKINVKKSKPIEYIFPKVKKALEMH